VNCLCCNYSTPPPRRPCPNNDPNNYFNNYISSEAPPNNGAIKQSQIQPMIAKESRVIHFSNIDGRQYLKNSVKKRTREKAARFLQHGCGAFRRRRREKAKGHRPGRRRCHLPLQDGILAFHNTMHAAKTSASTLSRPGQC